MNQPNMSAIRKHLYLSSVHLTRKHDEDEKKIRISIHKIRIRIRIRIVIVHKEGNFDLLRWQYVVLRWLFPPSH